jgi:hypothetical protein
VERQRRAALERVAAGLTVDVGLCHLPAEITAVLGDVGQQGEKPKTRPLNHDARRDLRENHEQGTYSPLFIISTGQTCGREGKSDEGTPLATGTGAAEVSPKVASPAGQPAAMSWAMRNALHLIEDARRREGKQPWAAREPLPGVIAVSGVVAEAPAPVAAGVKTYPSLNLAAVRAGKAPLYRVWLYARQLDAAGRGWVKVSELRQAMTGLEGALTWRRLRQILNEGGGTFWTFDNPDRLRYMGAAALGAHLGVDRLTGRPVILPAAALDASIGGFRAALFATFHAGRAKEGRRPRPISRQALTGIAGVSAATQQRYDRRAGVKRRRNLAITGRYSQEAAQEQAWQHGGSFTFDDKAGKQGERGGRYLARPLPNSYQARIVQGPNGRQKKINFNLSLLVASRAKSGARERRERLFYDDGAAAGKFYNRNPRRDAFFPQQLKAEAQIWNTLPAQPD